jgi:plasmid stabilization system protein ParE
VSLPIEFHPHAEFEVEEARDWYLHVKKSPLAAARFVDELDAAIENTALQPECWPAYLSGTRRYLLARFPYLVIY